MINDNSFKTVCAFAGSGLGFFTGLTIGAFMSDGITNPEQGITTFERWVGLSTIAGGLIGYITAWAMDKYCCPNPISNIEPPTATWNEAQANSINNSDTTSLNSTNLQSSYASITQSV